MAILIEIPLLNFLKSAEFWGLTSLQVGCFYWGNWSILEGNRVCVTEEYALQGRK